MLEDLKGKVMQILMSEYDYTMDDASESVTDSVSEDPEMWHENASVEDLAKYLATDGADE